MSLPHARSAEAIDIGPLGARVALEKSTALFKSDQIEVIRLVLQAGRSLPPHQVPGDITLQCLEGVLDVTLESGSHLLRAGQMLFLPGRVRHGIVAVEDASALLTIVLVGLAGHDAQHEPPFGRGAAATRKPA